VVLFFKVSPKYSSMVSVITHFAGLKTKRLWCSNGFRTRRCPEPLQTLSESLKVGGWRPIFWLPF
jgi:hypothetical protein